MACYAYHKVQGQVGDCFSFVEKADTWFDNVNRTNSLDTWLSWCFVGLITSHCFMVVLSTGLIHQDSHTRGYWGEPTVSRGSCEVDYGLTQWVGELHNSYSNLMFLFVGLISFDQYRRHRLPRRMAIIAVFLLLMGLSGIALHITLQYQLELFNDISQAGLMVALYHCRGPAQYAAGYRPMALISAAHFLAAAGCLLMNIEWFRELHMLVMLCLILHQNYHGTKEHPRLFQRVMRAFFLILGCGPVSYTHLRAHETVLDLVCRLLLEKKKKTKK
eukprot:TRINITY_DN11563_c0_g1_i2.p1 TRINITY_DN11563_c0_g1~~TRINITY_DN11563_c0_g1_i2.p1  ORF type:complete len:274 (+),score=29.72 TRINITY_DN11563_c0_g1_i2:697-1518(+)